MADEQSVDTEDTSVSEVVDTSTNEDSDTDDSTLEDTDISWDDGVEEPDTDETETNEETDTEPTDSEEESEEDVEQSEEESSESTEEDTPPVEDSVSERKRLNDEMAKRRIAERELRETQKQIEQENLQRYLDEAQDDEIEYARRQNQIEAFNIQQEKIQLNHDRLQNAIDKAVATIDLFQNGTPEIKEELAASLDDFERMYVKYDDNGNPLEVKGDVYQYLQKKADSIKRLTGVGARQQIKDKSKTTARTQTPPSRAPKEAKPDPDIDGFDEEANRW